MKNLQPVIRPVIRSGPGYSCATVVLREFSLVSGKLYSNNFLFGPDFDDFIAYI